MIHFNKRSNKNYYCWLFVCSFATMILLSGCGSEARNSVSGTVTLGGNPLPTGFISFRSDSSNGGAEIKEGAYKLSSEPGLLAGEYTVRITAEEETGEVKKVPGSIIGTTNEVPVKRNLIPDEFGEKSTQKVTIAQGKNTFDFDIPPRVEK